MEEWACLGVVIRPELFVFGHGENGPEGDLGHGLGRRLVLELRNGTHEREHQIVAEQVVPAAEERKVTCGQLERADFARGHVDPALATPAGIDHDDRPRRRHRADPVVAPSAEVVRLHTNARIEDGKPLHAGLGNAPEPRLEVGRGRIRKDAQTAHLRRHCPAHGLAFGFMRGLSHLRLFHVPLPFFLFARRPLSDVGGAGGCL